MPDLARAYHKYNVERLDGRPIAAGCFVLELDDPKAWPALRVWADTVAPTNPGLAMDIRALVRIAEVDATLVGGDDA